MNPQQPTDMLTNELTEYLTSSFQDQLPYMVDTIIMRYSTSTSSSAPADLAAINKSFTLRVGVLLERLDANWTKDNNGAASCHQCMITPSGDPTSPVPALHPVPVDLAPINLKERFDAIPDVLNNIPEYKMLMEERERIRNCPQCLEAGLSGGNGGVRICRKHKTTTRSPPCCLVAPSVGLCSGCIIKAPVKSNDKGGEGLPDPKDQKLDEGEDSLESTLKSKRPNIYVRFSTMLKRIVRYLA